MTNRLPASVRALIENALSSAEMERCGVEPEHQEAMRIYLDTWVAHRLRRVLKWERGELSAADLDWYAD